MPNCATCDVAFKTKDYPTIDKDGNVVMVTVIVEPTILLENGTSVHAKTECIPEE